MSKIYKCTPELSQTQKTLLEKFEKLNSEQKNNLIETFPEGKLLPGEQQSLYISEIFSKIPHFVKSHLHVIDFQPLPLPWDVVLWSHVKDFVPATIFVAGMAPEKNTQQAFVAELIVTKINLKFRQDGNKEVVGVEMFYKEDLCLKLTNNWPSRSWSWNANFTGVEKPFKLADSFPWGGDGIEVFFDKTQTEVFKE
jgi:hypothetical protein